MATSYFEKTGTKKNKKGHTVTRSKNTTTGQTRRDVTKVNKKGRKVNVTITKNKDGSIKRSRYVQGGKTKDGTNKRGTLNTTNLSKKNKKGVRTITSQTKGKQGQGKATSNVSLAVKNAARKRKAGIVHKHDRPGSTKKLTLTQRTREDTLHRLNKKTAQRKKLNARIDRRTAAGKDTSALKAKRKQVSSKIKKQTTRAERLTKKNRKERRQAKKNA